MDYINNLQRVVDFHGHTCPFVVVGTLISNFALDMLSSERSEDEEVLCIAENDSCAIDAVQAIAGCTCGKGNLFIRYFGKHVYTFGLRESGKALRIYFDPGVFRGLSFEEKIEKARSLDEGALRYRWVDMRFPPRAEVAPSLKCGRCGEYAKESSMVEVKGGKVCIPCSREGED